MTEPQELDFNQELMNLKARVTVLEGSHVDHKELIASIKDDTAAVREFFEALRGFWRVLEFIGKLSKPLTVVAAIFGSYFAIKGIIK